MIYRHQRTVIQCGVRCLSTRWKFAGADRALENTAMMTYFSDLHVDLVAAGCGQSDADLIWLCGEIAVTVFDLRIDEITGLDLIVGASSGAWFWLAVVFILNLLFQRVSE